MGKAPSNSSLDASVIDGGSLFDAVHFLEERLSRESVTLNYSNLRNVLDSFRAQSKWRPSSINTVLLSADPSSDRQARFHTMLKRSGFDPDVSHYRESFVSVPPGRSPQETGKPIVSFSARIAYIAGLMARYPDPHFLVVTHSFELFAPLTDLVRRVPNGRVGIAYFWSLMDHRWKTAGLLDEKSPIKFFDLDPHSDDLMGIDPMSHTEESTDPRSGLSRF